MSFSTLILILLSIITAIIIMIYIFALMSFKKMMKEHIQKVETFYDYTLTNVENDENIDISHG